MKFSRSRIRTQIADSGHRAIAAGPSPSLANDRGRLNKTQLGAFIRDTVIR